MSHTGRWVAAFAVAAVAAVGLAAAASPVAAAAPAVAWPVTAARSHVQCPWRVEGPAARVFTSSRQWREAARTSEDQAVGAAVDWDAEDVIVFVLATQRTLGIKVDVEPEAVELRGRVARLQVRVTRPGPDDMVASALSRPCVAIKVAKRTWRVLEVRGVGEGRDGGLLWRGKVHPRRG